MSDDSLSEMPEFDKPENIPLVVPDVPVKKERKLRADHCQGTKKDGTTCGFAHQKNRPFCIQHDPAISEEQKQAWRCVPRKPRVSPMGNPTKKNSQLSYLSREEILAILSKRINVWMTKFGDILQPGIDDAICDLARAYALVAKVEVADGVEVRGWRMRASG